MSGDPRFARIPVRLLDQLQRGEISLAGFALRVYLIGRTNHHTLEFISTIAALRDALGWRTSDQHLRTECSRLEPDFDVQRRQGQRKAWIFRVKARDFGFDFKQEHPSDFEVTSNGGDGETPAEPLVTRAFSVPDFKRPEDPSADAAQPSSAQPQRQPQPESDPAAPAAAFNNGSVPDPTDHIAVLISEINDADDSTERVFRHSFGRLPEGAFWAARDRLRERRGRTDRQALRSEARFVHHFLREWPPGSRNRGEGAE